MSTLTIIAVAISDEGITILDANKQEYLATSPEQLWSDITDICEDTTLPSVSSQAVERPDFEFTPESLYELGCQQAEDMVGAAYGPMASALVGRASRAGSKSVLQALRNLSKRKRRFG